MRVPYVLCHNVVFYLRKIAWPTHLSSHYPFPLPFEIANSAILAGLVGTAVLIVLLAVSLRWTRAALAGWLVFFVAIFPTLGVIGFTIVIAADKFAYLPAVGLMLPLTALVGWLWDRAHGPVLSWRRAGVVVVVGLLAVSAGIATRGHIGHWQDTETLFRYMLTQSPEAPVLHSWLGRELMKQGRQNEAMQAYRQAITLASGQGADFHEMTARFNLGVALLGDGQVDAAIEQFQAVLRLHAASAEAHNGLGNAWLRKGRVDRAMEHYRQAIALEPDYADAHYNLANLLRDRGELDQAVWHYQEAIRADPRHVSSISGLGNIYWLQGDWQAAIGQYRRALAVDASHAFSHRNLADLLYQEGDVAGAVRHYRQALRLRPDWQEVAERLKAIYATHADDPSTREGRP